VLAFALAALVPAAVNPALSAGGARALVALCGGGSVGIPLDNPLPSPEGKGCCSKGCHSGERKRGKIARVDPPQ